MSIYKQENRFTYYKSGEDESPLCCAEECALRGTHRVILDFHNPKKVSYMCLDHIKAHNKSVNYYANMSIDQIESEIKADTVWRKPTWPLRGDAHGPQSIDATKDYFELFTNMNSSQKTAPSTFPKDIENAARVLGVLLPASLADIKKIYKKCVKACHPDLHRGEKNHEERLKKVNIAYKILINFLQPHA